MFQSYQGDQGVHEHALEHTVEHHAHIVQVRLKFHPMFHEMHSPQQLYNVRFAVSRSNFNFMQVRRAFTPQLTSGVILPLDSLKLRYAQLGFLYM
jgi:hypothetical protein